jgi:hypothetical protein
MVVPLLKSIKTICSCIVTLPYILVGQQSNEAFKLALRELVRGGPNYSYEQRKIYLMYDCMDAGDRATQETKPRITISTQILLIPTPLT